MDFRYFFIYNQVKTFEIKIGHFPAVQVVVDYLTKLLQGTLF